MLWIIVHCYFGDQNTFFCLKFVKQKDPSPFTSIYCRFNAESQLKGLLKVYLGRWLEPFVLPSPNSFMPDHNSNVSALIKALLKVKSFPVKIAPFWIWNFDHVLLQQQYLAFLILVFCCRSQQHHCNNTWIRLEQPLWMLQQLLQKSHHFCLRKKYVLKPEHILIVLIFSAV